MKRLIYKLLTKRNSKRYENYIEDHRYKMVDAFFEMVMNDDMNQWMDWDSYHVELYERVIAHDLSKYSFMRLNIW